jgi:hypothetical protein
MIAVHRCMRIRRWIQGWTGRLPALLLDAKYQLSTLLRLPSMILDDLTVLSALLACDKRRAEDLAEYSVKVGAYI